jgi:hypothetical protein
LVLLTAAKFWSFLSIWCAICLSLSLSLPLHIHGLHILRRLFRGLDDDDDAAYDFVLVGRKAFVHVVGEGPSNWNPSAKS